MLTIYRRHLKTCAHRSEGRKYRRCHCPIWVDGTVGNGEIRQSLKTRDWQHAQDAVREWEAMNQIKQLPQEQEVMTVTGAWSRFIADAKAKGLHEPTIRKYEHLDKQIKHYAEGGGMPDLRMDLQSLGGQGLPAFPIVDVGIGGVPTIGWTRLPVSGLVGPSRDE